MARDWGKALEQMDGLIRSGQSSRIRKLVVELYEEGAPAEHRAAFANICRRIGRADLSVKLLVRIVNAEDQMATTKERVAFAAGLIAIGAGVEGSRILSKLNTSEDPDILLYRAISHFTRWEYADSLPLLEQFIQHPMVNEYQGVIGRINLASALIFADEHLQAREVLQSFLKNIEKDSRFTLVAGNAYELLSQTAIGLREHKRTDEYLEKAQSFLGRDSGINKLFLDKWKAVNKLMQPDLKKQGLSELHRVAAEALKRKHWETIRETQLFLAYGTQDTSLFYKVFYGTPYAGYRGRAVKNFGYQHELPESYVHQLNPSVGPCSEILNLKAAALVDGNPFLPQGALLHRAFFVLARDIYRPVRIAEMFSFVYPEDYYDPYSSPHRVHEVINRLRKHLGEEELPLSIVEDGGVYSLASSENLGFRLHLDQTLPPPADLRLSHFLSRWSQPQFQAQDMAKVMDISVRSAQRLINSGIKNGAVTKIKGGRESTYLKVA